MVNRRLLISFFKQKMDEKLKIPKKLMFEYLLSLENYSESHPTLKDITMKEALEIQNLEKFVLNQERENYSEVQERIEKINKNIKLFENKKLERELRVLA